MAARGGEGEGWSLFSKLLISGLPDVVVSEIWASFSREQVVQWVRGKREILDSISVGAVRVLPPSIRNNKLTCCSHSTGLFCPSPNIYSGPSQ